MDVTNEKDSNDAVAWELWTQCVGWAGDFRWEQDAHGRLTRLEGALPADIEPAGCLGKTWNELGFVALDTATSSDFEAAIEARQPFRDRLLRRATLNAPPCFIRLRATPFFGPGHAWAGYRGVGDDVTARETELEELRTLRLAMDECPEPLFVCDTDKLRFIYASKAAASLTGFSRAELLKLGPHHLTQKSREETVAIFERAQAPDGILMTPYLTASKDGSRRGWWAPHHKTVLVGGRRLTVTTSREVSATVLAEEALQRERRMFATLSATNEAIVHTHTPLELFQQVCDAAVEWGQFVSAAVMLKNAEGTGLVAAAVAGAGRQRMRKLAEAVNLADGQEQGLIAQAVRSQLPCITNDFLADQRTARWHDSAEQISLRSAGAIPVVRDQASLGVLFLCSVEKRAFDDETLGLLKRMAENITIALAHQEHEADRKEAEARIRHLATHDSLTGLPNRVLFAELLDSAVRTAERYQRGLAVMYLDLDGFKFVNDTLGHDAGDMLLQTVTERWHRALRASDVLARMGGDEFVVLLQEVAVLEEAATIAQKLLDAAREPVLIRGQSCRVSTSIGIAMYRLHGTDGRSLVKNADAAMYVAKERGKNNYQVFATEAPSFDDSDMQPTAL
jgi:diguanylate cyclase (GGDEF)-like protein/PAS domain S-box-containing protein